MFTSLLFLLVASAQLPGETAFLSGDASQRAGQWGPAIAHFETVAKSDEALAPYAQLRIAQSLARTGDLNGAAIRYREVLALPEGPWTAMAQARLASLLLQQQQFDQAVQLKERFHALPVEPWWMDDVGKSLADAMLRLPDRKPQGFDYYHKQALNSIYPKVRTEAAGKLVASHRPDDRAAAALGYFRSASPREAAAVLTGSIMFEHPVNGTEMMKLTAPEAAGEANLFEQVARANPESLWVRAWLIQAARSHADAKRWELATRAAFAIADVWPEERDTGDTLNTIVKKLEAAQGFDVAVPLYYKMANASPSHHHSDDGMLHVGNTYAARGNHAEALRAYRKLGELKDAKLQDLGYYKAAELSLKIGDKEGAAADFDKGAALAPGKFYAHRALDRLGRDGGVNLRVDGQRPYLQARMGMQAPAARPSPMVANAPQFTRLAFFGRYGLEEGEWEALGMLEKLGTDPAHDGLYQAIAEAGFAHTALQFAIAHGWGVKNGEATLAYRRLELPLAYWPEVTQLARETGVDPYLILAVAKQESTFRATVVSHAGASGVMQLMPKTASWLESKDPDIPAGTSAHLKSPLNSIRLGANYLEQMIERSGGNLVYAVASYNGGPGNVDKWRKQNPTTDLDAWIEFIPFSETQDYVRKVLGYYMAYHSLYPPAKL